MPYRIQLRSDLNLVILRWSGEITHKEIEEWLAEAPRMAGFRPGLNLLSDTRGCTTAIDWWQIRSVAALAREHEPAWGHSKWATVVSGDLIYGLARMYTAFASQRNVVNRVFRDVDPALAWLKSGTDIGAALDKLETVLAETELSYSHRDKLAQE